MPPSSRASAAVVRSRSATRRLGAWRAAVLGIYPDYGNPKGQLRVDIDALTQRWPDAQQAYFQAHQLQPDNPDYAFNLAVALEHIGQPKAALDFYRRAVQAATSMLL